MAIYQLGSHGSEVVQIQNRLKELGLLSGPVDGYFDGAAESAAKTFQARNNLSPDGKIGPATWSALFPDQPQIPAPRLLDKPIDFRCLALTGAFETSTTAPNCFAALSGDFDGQGMSYGALQWNWGQGTLQPLLKEMDQLYRPVLQTLFHENYPTLAAVLQKSVSEQLEWIRSVQHPQKFSIFEPWNGMYKALGRTDEFQRIQENHAQQIYRDALAFCREFQVHSQRAVALLFDIRVQNGSFSDSVKANIAADYASLDASLPPADLEVARLRIVANRRADEANPKWREDVRARKLVVANGKGTVHGAEYDLAEQYGLTLDLAF